MSAASNPVVLNSASVADANVGNSVNTPLSLNHVSFWYGDVVAVNDISASVGPGITGLLGPNGAGKSTLLQLATGLLTATSGTVSVFGKSPTSGSSVYNDIGLVPEAEALPGNMSARAFVATRAVLLGLPNVKDATNRALATVELETVADRKLGGFSKGMKQRAKLAAALVHEPRLVLLDEPFNGLDPRQRVGMMRLLESRASDGVAVLLSSHILEEIERVASRILVMLAGRLAATGDYRSLRRLMTDRPHTVHLRSSNDRALASALVANDTVVAVELDESGLTVKAADYSAFARAVGPAAQKQNISVFEIKAADENLEHVFAYLVGRP